MEGGVYEDPIELLLKSFEVNVPRVLVECSAEMLPGGGEVVVFLLPSAPTVLDCPGVDDDRSCRMLLSFLFNTMGEVLAVVVANNEGLVT